MRKLSTALLLTTLVTTAPAYCKSEGKQPEAKKHATVDQIIDAVEAEKPTDEEQEQLKQKCNERVDRFIDVVADKTNMSPEEKAKLKEKIKSKREAHKSLPPEAKAKLDEQLDLKNFTKQTTFQVLADHLDDTDLKSILRFIKSPTGKKLLKQGPDMIGQAVELTAERYVPMIIELGQQFKALQGLPPGSANPEKRKELIEKLQQMLKNNLQQQKDLPLTGPGKNEI